MSDLSKTSKTLNRNAVTGFTLVEILVVITILGLLIAIAIPVTSRALQKTRTMESLSNLRQLGMAANLYTIDNQDYLPRTVTPDGYWFQYLLSYLQLESVEQRRKVLVCPVANANQKVAVAGSFVPTTYTMPDVFGVNSSFKSAAIKRPSKMILFATGPQVLADGGTTASFWLPWQGFAVRDMDEPATPIEEGFGGLDYRFDGKL